MPVFQSINPYSRSLIMEYPLMDESMIRVTLDAAAIGFEKWRRMHFDERAAILLNAAKILRADKDKYATLITREMGKVLQESLGEVEKCAWVCEYYAENSERFLADEQIDAGYHKSIVTYEPIGAVLAIMPWNFPFWQVFRYAAPTLMAGNVTILKHAPNVSGCTLAIAEIFKEAGAPAGVFQSIIIETDLVEKILGEPIVQAVTLTGSERAGSSVASIAGRNVKKSLLELGGSDALIVLKDADFQKAATVALQSRMLNAGQSCIGAKRFIVVKDAIPDFMQLLLDGIKLFRQGDPMQTGITTGPLARLDLADNLSKQLTASTKAGAKLEFGGGFDGCNVMPSLLVNVQPGMAAFDQETFGPLATVITADDEQQAIELANHSSYGLGGSVWTQDIDRGIRIAKQISSGAVFINSLVKSDPRLPFGGIKKSGYGRELGRHGILEFVNAKTIAAEL